MSAAPKERSSSCSQQQQWEKELPSLLESLMERGGGKDWDQEPTGSKGWENRLPAAVLITSLSLLPLFLSLGSFSSFCSFDGFSPPLLSPLNNYCLVCTAALSSFSRAASYMRTWHKLLHSAMCWQGETGGPPGTRLCPSVPNCSTLLCGAEEGTCIVPAFHAARRFVKPARIGTFLFHFLLK